MDNADSDGGVLTLGTTSAKSSMTMRPAGAPPMVTSKKTLGLDILMGMGLGVLYRFVVVVECCVEREG